MQKAYLATFHLLSGIWDTPPRQQSPSPSLVFQGRVSVLAPEFLSLGMWAVVGQLPPLVTFHLSTEIRILKIDKTKEKSFIVLFISKEIKKHRIINFQVILRWDEIKKDWKWKDLLTASLKQCSKSTSEVKHFRWWNKSKLTVRKINIMPTFICSNSVLK